MNYTFKLSRRLARFRGAILVAASLLTLSCAADDGLNGPDRATPTDPTKLVISPSSTTLGVEQAMQFQAALDTSSLTTSFKVTKCKGRGRSSSCAQVVSLTMDPGAVSLIPGGSQGFSATATLTDGSIAQTSLAWTATGGTVDASGKYTAGTLTGTYRVIATTSNGVADTAAVTITATPPVVAEIVLSPATTSLPAGGSAQFTAVGKSADGATVSVSPRYRATGGTVSSTGLYSAGQTPGNYQVIATDSATGDADSSAVTIAPPSPTLQAVVLTPASITLQTGATQQFGASGQMSDGSTTTVSVTFSATGGTITSGGLYTAGSSAGSYRVIATQSAGTLADTSAVSIAASTSPQPTGVAILPGQSIQAAVDANPVGTTFLIKAGTHRQQSVLPKAGDTFLCEAGAVMDGEGVTPYAFKSANGDPDNVTIKHCRITNYVPPAQMGAILAGGNGAATSTAGWLVDSCQIDHNANGGIRLGGPMLVRGNVITYNGQIGLVGGGTSGLVVEGNEIAYNNPSNTGIGQEAGGTKFVGTTNLIVRNNWAHHNNGPALWADINNIGYLFEGNLVEDNNGAGIAIEISYGGVIRNNTVRRNGPAGWGFGSAIEIAGSGGAGLDIYGNTVTATTGNGIMLIQQNRGSGIYGPYVVQNVSVHDNTTTLAPGGGSFVAGAVSDYGTEIYSSRNNHFEHNTYNLAGATIYPFAWAGGYKTDAQWRAYGHDDTGTFNR